MLKDSDYLTCPALSAAPHARHGFFTRKGGKSKGIYASLNCGPGSGDVLDHVWSNRGLVAKTLGASQPSLITCHQIHSADVVTVDKPWTHENAPKADAMATNQPGIVLGILTADCLPVLFADAKRPVIGAAHAGWKGAQGGVLENTLAAMEKLGSQRVDIVATIGPAIAQTSYEVGPEFRARFIEQAADNALYFVPSARENHYQFDLKTYAANRLKKAGISRINLLERDTCFEEDSFFSFRRTTLQNESAYGRQISVITIRQI